MQKVKDNLMKRALSNPELCADFIHDFISRRPASGDDKLAEILAKVRPEDIEDVETRYLPLNREGKDSDVVVKVTLRGLDEPLFILGFIEHQSNVNHRMAFRMLEYIGLILVNYENEINTEKNISGRAGFKYPPVLPVVFYDGKGKWTAETNFRDKTQLNDIFGKYIPSFEYMVVNLNDYSMEDIAKCTDALSILMLLDKPKKPGEMKFFDVLPESYREYINGMKLPYDLKKLVLDFIDLLSTKVELPEKFVEEVKESLETKGAMKMFDELAENWKKERAETDRLRSQNEQYRSQLTQRDVEIAELRQQLLQIQGR
jgi:hypothetical protein